MKHLAALLLFLGTFACSAADRTISLQDATVTLTNGPCVLGTHSADDKMRGGQVVFKNGLPPRKLCWLEEGDAIWTLDEALVIGRFAKSQAVSKGLSF